MQKNRKNNVIISQPAGRIDYGPFNSWMVGGKGDPAVIDDARRTRK